MIDYQVADKVATITMDDGKVNALSPTMLDAISDALQRAQKDDVGAVVLSGRPGRFSGGFDLGVMSGGGDAISMVRRGFEVAAQMLSFPRPLVVACTGHAIAMGAFLLLSGDHRVGAAGDFKIQANEVAIGMTLPYAALAITRYRLTPPAFDRAINVSALFTPADAVAVGWLDEVVDADAVVATARERAAAFASSLNPAAHAASKLRARERLLAELREALDSGDRL